MRWNGGAVAVGGVLLLAVAPGSVDAQVLIANEDVYGVPFGTDLVVEAFGVLNNDTLDGEPAGENGVTAELVVDAAHGTLVLAADGSFTYSPGVPFDGTDQFVYRAVFGASVDTAAVSLSACSGGPDVFDCWNETAFLAKAAEHGFGHFVEGFENDAVWGGARSPNVAAAVSSQGVEWRSNHPDPPASNGITTGSGAAWEGQWGIFDPEHGYATGTPTECDVNNPPEHCLYHDGFTGTREPGQSVLHGVGGYFTGIYGANVGIVLDGGMPIGGGTITGGYRFFGAIDVRPAGFTQFQFRELDGKVGQALFVFGDHFTLVTPEPVSVAAHPEPRGAAAFAGPSPNPTDGSTTLRFRLPLRAVAELSIYDVRGRRVRQLADGVRGDGWHTATWDARTREGRAVASGVYFGRLVVRAGDGREILMRKIVVGR